MTDADIIANARERFQLATDAEKDRRERMSVAMGFMTRRGQWRDEDRAARDAQGKPTLTIDIIGPAVRQVNGQIRQMNPAIKVAPGDQEASKETAEVIEGLIRHIEDKSGASRVYEAAALSAVICGIGWMRVRTDYCDDTTFNQEIIIDRVYNAFSVFCDPAAKHPTRKDMAWAFVVSELPETEFKATWPDAKIDDLTSDHRPPELQNWVTGQKVVVAEYFWTEYEEYEIGLMADGTVVKYPKPPLNFVRKRKVKEPRIKWAKITGSEVLEGPIDVPGKFIPLVAVIGEEFHAGEEVILSGLVEPAMDGQMVYNITRSAMVEVTMMQPRAPYLVTAKQVEGLSEFWNVAHTANRPYLPYNFDKDAPPPMRVPPPIASQGLLAEAQLAYEDVRRTTGIHEAALGAKSNETSGVAIERRQAEAQNSQSAYGDHAVESVEHMGHVIYGMIPHVYDTKRTVRILGEDDQEKMVVINDLMMSADGVVPVNDMTTGKYDIRISVGPTYSTKRQEASEGMMQFLQVLPQTAPLIADLIAKAQDWPDSERMAERLRKTLPPGMAEQDDENPQAMQAQQQAQQEAAAKQAEAEAIAKRQAVAEAEKTENEAAKVAAEAQKLRIENAAMGGKMTELVQRVASDAVQADRAARM